MMDAVITGKALDLTRFLLNENIDYEALWDLTPHKEPRSKKSNAYFHRLVGLLAQGEKMKFYQKKNELILQYGNHEFIRDKEGKLVYELLDDNDDWKYDPEKHYYPTEFTDTFCGVRKRAFVMFTGTHTYHSKDMTYLIECTRNECLGCGLSMEEIETFEEKRLMEELRKRVDAEANKSSGNSTQNKSGS